MDLTIAAFIMTQPVITAYQVQCHVQVRVDLVYSVTNGFQSHSPVWSFWLLSVGTDMKEASTGEQSQEKHTHRAVVEHSTSNQYTATKKKKL